MPLLPRNEKVQSQSMPLPAEVIFFMQNQAPPTYHQMLKLGLGLGGILNIFCIPAMAEPLHGEIAEATAEPSAPEINNPDLRENHGQPLTKHRGANHRSDRSGMAHRRVLLSEGAFIPEPKLTRHSFRKAADPTVAIETDPALPANEAAASQATAPNEISRGLLPPVSEHTPQFSQPGLSPTVAVETPQPAATLQAVTSKVAAQQVAVQAKPEPWSIAALESRHSPTQELSVSEVEHIELAWGEASHQDTGRWLHDLAQGESQPSHELAQGDLAEDEFAVEPSGDADESLTAFSSAEETAIAEEEADIIPKAPDALNLEGKQLTSRSEGDTAETINADDGSTEDLESPDLLSEILEDQGVVTQAYPLLDEELGTLRVIQVRSRETEDLGFLRVLQRAQVAPSKPAAPIAFLGGRLGFVDVNNVFRTNDRVEEQIYQAGTSLYLLPKLSDTTSFYAIAETNIARYNNTPQVNYNEIQLQAGLRQRLGARTYAQVGWRNQRLYSPGYREKLFGVNYIDALVSHRSVLSSKVWLDSFYQMRLGFADPREASRFRQTITLSLNYGITRELRTSLLYQLDFDDYTQVPRYDTYQQILGIVSYNITPESRISLFGGTRFGNSSEARVNLDDTFYGAGLNVSVPLF